MNDHDLTAATERLATRLRLAEHLLRSDLAQAVAAHDLTRAQLVGVEANARRQSRAGVALTADEFWNQTAQPQAAVLLTACRRIQDEAGKVLGDTLWRHGRAVAALGPEPADAGRWRKLVEAEVHRLGSAFIPPTTIDGLGQWWQNRLRRRATMLAVSSSLLSSSPLSSSLLKPAARFSLLLAQSELELARRPSWSHGDRLLAAFELAHADLQARAGDIEYGLTRQAGALIDTIRGRDATTTPADLGFRTSRPPTGLNQGNDRARGPATGNEPPTMIELR